MRHLHAAFNWVRHLFLRSRFEREMQREMETHIEHQTILNQARGMSAGDALAAARREFGNVPYLQEQSRDARGTRIVEETVSDVRYGVRSLLRTPGFTLVVLLSLALGIAVNTTLFTIIRYVSRPAVSNPSTFVSARFLRLTYQTWKAIESETGLFSRSAAHYSATVAIARPDQSALEADVRLVSDGYFGLYQTLPMHGRLLVPGDEQNAGGTPAAVLSYAFWQREFGADSGVVGRQLRLSNGSLFAIVGVAPVEFGDPNLRTPDIWVPLTARALLPDNAAGAPFDWLNDPMHRWLTFEGRLAPGVSIEQARMRLKSIVEQSGTADSALAANMWYRLKSADDNGQRLDVARPRVAFVLASTFLVLLIGCANVANLVLARGVRRRREIAVRLSLGAGRVRLIRQLTTECLILAVAGGACAMVLSAIALRLFATSEIVRSMSGPNAGATFVAQLRLTPASVLFTFAAAFVSAAACGLLPALRSTKIDLSRAARDEGSHLGSRLRGAKLRAVLVGGQVAFALLLLTITSVLGRSAINAGVMDTGFDRAHLAISQIGKSQTGYSEAQMQVFADGYATRLAALVGDSNVARGTIPMTAVNRLRVNPDMAGLPYAAGIQASENFLRVMGIRLKLGRSFTELEARNSSPVAVIGETLARRLWSTTSVLGHKLEIAELSYSDTSGSEILSNRRFVTVIGVVSDAQFVKIGESNWSLIYLPSRTGDFVIRTSEPERLVSAIRDAGRAEDPNVLLSVASMNDHVNGTEGVSVTRVIANGAGRLGLLALTLSLIGIFGVVSYAVSQRTREIGVRLAIGAQRTDVLTMMIFQGLRPALYGAIIGLLLAAAVTKGMSAILFGVSSLDPIAFLGATGAVLIAATLACYVPARRAMGIDPMGAMRAD